MWEEILERQVSEYELSEACRDFNLITDNGSPVAGGAYNLCSTGLDSQKKLA